MEPTFSLAAFGRRSVAGVLALLMLAPLAGCRLCADGDEHAYPAYGGAWQRTHRDTGRVGSIFEPAGGRTPELVDRNQPPEIDAIQRDERDEDEDEEPTEDEPGEAPREPGPDEAERESPEESLRDLQLQDI